MRRPVAAVRRHAWGTISPSLDTLSTLAHGLDISLRTLFSTFEQRKRDDVADAARRTLGWSRGPSKSSSRIGGRC